MNSPTLAGSYPKIGIRPTIDGRLGGVREQWTDYRPNGDFLEAILNSSFDWNGRRAPYLVATENDAMNGASVLLDCVPPERLARVRHARPRGGRLPRLREFRPALPLNLMTPTHDETRRALLAPSHELGAEHRHLAILGEGNTSAKLDGDGGTFLVKASGSSLGTLGEAGVVECRAAPLLAMLDRTDPGDQEIEDALFACRVDPQAGKPSVEALFHAYLLSLPNVGFVGHVHSVAVNQLLCSPRAREFAGRRLFADEIVCCGAESVFVPYTDPGLRLAQAIRQETARLIAERGSLLRVILLENHGISTFGASPEAVKAALYMADKAARIFIGTLAAGGPNFLTAAQMDRIANRIDEHYRQRALNL